MIKSIANKITSFLYYNNFIDSDKYEYDVYLYGFESMIALILNTVSILLIGLLFDRFIHTVVFLMCYFPLRQFTGGYHADTYEKCFFTFVSIFIATIFIANNLDYEHIKLIILLFSVVNWSSICLLAPVDHINNILEYDEKGHIIEEKKLGYTRFRGEYQDYTTEQLIYKLMKDEEVKNNLNILSKELKSTDTSKSIDKFLKVIKI